MAIDNGKLQEEEASSVTRFYNIILGWDYKQLTKENERKNRKDSKEKLNVVKNTYKDVDDYFETFEPLLFEEVKAQILQNKDGEEASVCKMRLVMECNEGEGFHFLLVTYEHEEDEYLAQNDLLLLSKEEVKGNSFPSSYGFAVVEHRQNNLLRLRMYLAEDIVQITKNTKSSRTKSFIQALSNMRSLITSSASPIDKRVFSLKVSCYETQQLCIVIISFVFFHKLDDKP
jgi:senataxin